MLQRGSGIAGTPGVNRRELDDGAARRHQPVKTASLWQQANRSRRLAAATDQRNGLEISARRLEVERRVERREPRRVELDARLEEIDGRARHDHANVDQFPTVDAGDDANDRV